MIPKEIQEWMEENSISYEDTVFLIEMLQKYRQGWPINKDTLSWALHRNNEFQDMGY